MNQEIYVKEMPKSCGCCEFYSVDNNNYSYCLKLCMKLRYVDKDKDCPLKSLKQYDKELVEKVFEEIKLKFGYYELVDEIKEKIDFDKIKNDVLDQIQKGFKDE